MSIVSPAFYGIGCQYIPSYHDRGVRQLHR